MKRRDLSRMRSYTASVCTLPEGIDAMSSVTVPHEIDYPESDGKPMGETELHRDWTIRILDILRQRYRDQQVYVASDLLLYYEQGVPTKFVVPDCFVVLNCAKHRRRTFQTWKEGRGPDVVIEVTSRSTSSVDTIDKPKIYERMGVQEYFLFDPTADYLESSFQGYRLIDGCFHEILPAEGRHLCLTLGVDFSLSGHELLIFDSETGVEQVTRADFEESARHEAEQGQERERRAKDREREQKEREQAALGIANERIRELEQELRRLRSEKT